MQVTRISDIQHPLAEEWWNLYESAFPVCERRGTALHTAALADPAFHCLHISDAIGFVGLLSYWQWSDLCYVEHFAIAESRRGQGLGHRVLKLLPEPFILEIEPVENEITARRLAFYESCGMVRLSQQHVQLAYQRGMPDIPLWLLSRPALDAVAVQRFELLFLAGPMQYRDEA